MKYDKPRQPLPVTVTPLGMVELNVTNERGYPQAIVVFHHHRGMHIMLLSIVGSVLEYVMRLPHVDFTIEGKPTFSTGSNVNLQVSFRISEGETIVDWTEFQPDLYSRLASTTDVLVPIPVELNFDNNDMTVNKALLQINTLSENVEGLLSIKSMIVYECYKDCLLITYVIDEQVPIHQEDHRGPFFDHFVGVPRLEAVRGVGKQHCVYGDTWPCMVRCEFIGDHPKAVQLVRSGAEANLTPPTLISSAVSDYWAEGWFQVEDLKLGVSKDFQCKAKSCHGETAFNISLTSIQKVKIKKETTRLTKFDNGSVVLTCQAEGIPTPRVLISDGYLHQGLQFFEDIASSTYDMKVTKRFNSPMAELHIHDINTVTQSFIRCLAFQGVKREDGYFLFDQLDFFL